VARLPLAASSTPIRSLPHQRHMRHVKASEAITGRHSSRSLRERARVRAAQKPVQHFDFPYPHPLPQGAGAMPIQGDGQVKVERRGIVNELCL